MSTSAQISLLAQEFLATTNPVYDECEQGIRRLDQIVVGVSSLLADHARMALTPVLYAYWERFFRMTLGEYIRVIATYKGNLLEFKTPLAKEWLRIRCGDLYKTHKVQRLTEMPSRVGVESTLLAIEQLYTDVAKPLSFDPSQWVDTENNVAFHVVERNFEKLGIDVDVFRNHFTLPGKTAFALLKTLVDARNTIAHGETLAPTSSATWNNLRSSTLDLMNAFQLTLHDMILGAQFLE